MNLLTPVTLFKGYDAHEPSLAASPLLGEDVTRLSRVFLNLSAESNDEHSQVVVHLQALRPPDFP